MKSRGLLSPNKDLENPGGTGRTGGMASFVESSLLAELHCLLVVQVFTAKHIRNIMRLFIYLFLTSLEAIVWLLSRLKFYSAAEQKLYKVKY